MTSKNVKGEIKSVRTRVERRCVSCYFKIPSTAFCFRTEDDQALCTRCGLKYKDVLKDVNELVEFEKEVQIMKRWLSSKQLDERTIRNLTAKDETGTLHKAAHEAFKSPEVRRHVKKLMKEHIRRYSAYWSKMESHPELINFWVREEYNAESMGKGWIIKGDTENAKKVLDDLGQPWEGVEIHSAYDCTGQWFAWEADFTECGDRTFVTQHWGLDV